MRFLHILTALGGLTYCAVSTASGAAVTAIREIPGYRCMALNLNAQQMMDPSVVVPVLSQPLSTAPQIGIASSTVAAKDPLNITNGFIEVLFPLGQSGWVIQSYLRPWQPAAGTSARCKPAWLSNGRLGFNYPN